MQWFTTIATRVRGPTPWLAAPVVCVGLLAATVWAPPAGDAALIASAAVVGVAAGLLAREVARVGGLPMEIAPVALLGEVDARPIVRFRARLGLGRALRDAGATVRFLGPEGEIEVRAVVPAGVLIGPFTVLVPDPPPGPGTWRIRVTATSGGRAWASEAVVPSSERRGRFGGVSPQDGSVRFDDDWAAVVEEPAVPPELTADR